MNGLHLDVTFKQIVDHVEQSRQYCEPCLGLLSSGFNTCTENADVIFRAIFHVTSRSEFLQMHISVCFSGKLFKV